MRSSFSIGNMVELHVSLLMNDAATERCLKRRRRDRKIGWAAVRRLRILVADLFLQCISGAGPGSVKLPDSQRTFMLISGTGH
jgi:hypothetical protein